MKTTDESKIPQAAAILKMLQAGRKITPLHALNEIGCFRLGARIWDLKRAGHKIETAMVTNEHGVRFAEYSLATAPIHAA